MQYNITYREKDKGWQYIISYKDTNGKWKQKSKQGYKTKREAKIGAELKLTDLKNTENLNKDFEGITFKEFCDIYIEHIELHLQNNTVRLYRMALKHFEPLNNIEMTKIQTIDIQRCVDAMIKKGLSFRTVKTYSNRIHAIFNSAIDKFNIISVSPFKGVTFKIDKEPSTKKALTLSELNDLIAKTKNYKYKVIFSLAGKCGLRIGEILGLTWDKIDFTNNTITINIQWKNKGDGEVGFGELKSKNSYRTIPLSPDTKKVLIEYKKIVPVHISNRVVYYKCVSGLTKMLRNYCNKIGYDLSIHEFRHTYATNLIANNVDFKTVAKLMGHDVEQTMKTYSHVTSEMMDNAINVINKNF